MKISENWLREWVNPKIDTATLVARLTQAGHEVDSFEPVAGDFSGIIVGQVSRIEAHPDADKLQICTVDIGEDEALSIVCGAANVRQDLKIPVAVVGAVLPGNFKIKKAKLRGIPSFGMLCSTSEMGLTSSADGLMELPADAPIGTDMRAYLSLDDMSIDFDLTPNRGDCFSVAGIAREVGVMTGEDVSTPDMPAIMASTDEIFPVKNDVPAICPSYVGRVINGIDSTAETPLWMQEKLRRSGLRSLGAVVDVTNYVMLELGQPMHAFDKATLDSKIVIRMATADEALTLLDGQEITLTENSAVIADASGAIALAGIMGGERTSVSDSTKNIVLEAAFFIPTAIAGRARGYGLHTDSSLRFERGVDPALAERAIERATALLLEIVGGEAGSINAQVSTADLPKSISITLREARITRVLGIHIERAQVREFLTRLDMLVTDTDAGWQVEAPSFRFDMAIEADLIEELGRLYGYDKLPQTRPQGTVLATEISEQKLSQQRLQNVLIDRGYQEAITYSFVAPQVQALFSEPDQTKITLANPISADLSEMRHSLWAGLSQAMAHNLNRQHTRVRLFEIGRVFTGTMDDLGQEQKIAGIITGSRHSEQWATPQQPVDFFDIKADVENLLSAGGGAPCQFIAAEHVALHPGQSAQIIRNGTQIGWVGALHPTLEKTLGFSQRVYVFELGLESVLTAKTPTFTPLSKFPAIRRDLALLVDENITAANITDCLQGVNSGILTGIQLFDLYAGKGIEAGKKSIAVALTLQDNDKTLVDEEVDAVITQAVTALENDMSATIRT